VPRGRAAETPRARYDQLFRDAELAARARQRCGILRPEAGAVLDSDRFDDAAAVLEPWTRRTRRGHEADDCGPRLRLTQQLAQWRFVEPVARGDIGDKSFDFRSQRHSRRSRSAHDDRNGCHHEPQEDATRPLQVSAVSCDVVGRLQRLAATESAPGRPRK
jgi:hypothetical protein